MRSWLLPVANVSSRREPKSPALAAEPLNESMASGKSAARNAWIAGESVLKLSTKSSHQYHAAPNAVTAPTANRTGAETKAAPAAIAVNAVPSAATVVATLPKIANAPKPIIKLSQPPTNLATESTAKNTRSPTL